MPSRAPFYRIGSARQGARSGDTTVCEGNRDLDGGLTLTTQLRAVGVGGEVLVWDIAALVPTGVALSSLIENSRQRPGLCYIICPPPSI